MAIVEQSIHGCPAPAQVDGTSSFDSARDASELGERDVIQVSALGQGDSPLGYVCPYGQVNLAPALAPAQGPNCQTHTPIVHPGKDASALLRDAQSRLRW